MTLKHASVVVAALAVALAAGTTAPRAAPPPHLRSAPSQALVAEALCVHAGRLFTTAWRTGARPQYALFGHLYYLAHDYDDVTSGPGPNGEGPWPGIVGGSYGGGLSFEVGTWNHASDLSGGTLERVSSTEGIAEQPVWAQVLAATLIVREDGSWREWPNTSRSCGLY